MSASSYVGARIEPQLKDNVSHVLSEMGLTVSDAVRMFLLRVESEKSLPFDAIVPNKKTIAAMEAAEKREIAYCENLDELLK